MPTELSMQIRRALLQCRKKARTVIMQRDKHQVGYVSSGEQRILTTEVFSIIITFLQVKPHKKKVR
jgi:hypothetical protein